MISCRLQLLLLPAALLLLAPLRAPAFLNPSKAITQYVRDAWTTDNGLPQNSVLCTAQTPDGYLWIGSEAGLIRFNGVEFKTFNKANVEALHANEVDSLLVDRQGILWIGTRGGGLTRYENGRFKSYSDSVHLPSGSVASLAQDSAGNIWVGTDGGGLAYIHSTPSMPNAVEVFNHSGGLSDNSVFALTSDGSGGVWIGTGQGLDHWSKGKLVPLSGDLGRLSGHEVRSLLKSGDGRLWVGTADAGLWRYDSSGLANFRTADGLSSIDIASLAEDDQGIVWAGTLGGGLNRIQEGRISRYTTKEGLLADDVLSLSFDREGSLWIGSAGGGLNRLREASFTPYGRAEGLASDVALAVFEDREGVLWIGSPDAGVTKIAPGQTPDIFNEASGLGDNQIFSIAEDAAGNHWFGTRKGLSRLSGTRFTTFGAESGFPPGIISCVLADSKGSIWVTSRNGLSHFDGQRFQTFTTADGLASNHVLTVYEDKGDGSLWVGTDAGLSHLLNGIWQNFSSTEGLPSDTIWAITGDSDGTLWLGGNTGGLIRFRNGKFVSASTKNGLIDDELLGLLEDPSGAIWMSSNRGVFSITKSEYGQYAEGKVTGIHPRYFTERDGMRTRECNGAFQPAAWSLRDGRLGFATMKGLVLVDPSALVRNRVPPSVVIERIIIDGKTLTGTGPFTLDAGSDKLQFSFAALSFINSDQIHYYYQLEGYDRHWNDAGSQHSAFYTNIPPGSYRFRVYAVNSDGVKSPAEASVPVVISAFLYQTTGFKLVCLIASLLSIGIAYRLRVRQLHLSQQRLEALVSRRTEQLSASEKKFRQLAENIREVFWVMEAGPGTFSYVSPSYESLWDSTQTEVQSNPDLWLRPLHPEDRRAVKAFHKKLQEHAVCAELEYRLVKGDAIRWVWDRGFPILSGEGKLERVVGVVEDITERKEAERVLRRSNDELEQCVFTRTAELLALNEALQTENGERRRTEAQLTKAKEAAEAANEAKTQFLANVSHEIRTPMNGVIGMTDLVLDTELSTNQRYFLSLAKGSATSLLTIIDDILDFSKIEARQMALRPEPMCLRDCLSETIGALSARAIEKELKLDYVLDDAIPETVVGDPIRLRQILINLVGNAIKFTNMGGIHVSARLLERGNEDMFVEFCVEDTGVGIDKKQQKLIFEAFRQADGSLTREFGGTGLGLSISSRLVNLMNGRIWVDSELGKGSRFFFTARFGSFSGSAQNGQNPDTHGALVSQEETQQSLHILVVEDNLVNQRLARALLCKHGHTVVVAANGRQGIEKLLENDWKFDLVFMDVQMPEMDGLTATQEIRRMEAERGIHLPIIAVTAHVLDRDRERCLSAGMDEYLPKPIQPDRLLAMLKRFTPK